MKGSEFATKRLQAERNAKSHIDQVLSEAAVSIAQQAAGITIVSSEAMFASLIKVRAELVISEAMDEINSYIKAYSKAAISVLGDKDTGATGRLLNSELFGKTFMERSETYMQYFFHDVLKIIIAGKRLKMKQSQIVEAVRQQYSAPYATGGLIDQARRKGFQTIVPSYGRGIYHCAFDNIVRNAQGTIAIAWGKEDRNKARRDGVTGFIVFRGSDYDCPTCDGEVNKGIHHINDEMPPYHVNCCCFVEYVYGTE